MIDRPIILLGTHRSGTTYLGKVFSEHPQLAYWPEPRHVWTWGNSYRPDDVLVASDVTPRTRAHIHKEVERFVQQEGGDRLIEKTPSNCMRVAFLHELFPDAIFMHIVRDGRSVLRSTEEILRGGIPSHRIMRRAFQTPPWEWPAYIPQALGALKRKFTKQPLAFWGPRPPGWQTWLDEDPMHVVLARQWTGTVQRALDDGQALPSEQYLEFKYEDFVCEPKMMMERLLDFAQLDPCPEMVERVVASVDPTRVHKWRQELDESTLHDVRPVMEPMLDRLGYAWDENPA